ncbi:MAG: DUF1523 family protein [Pseudomonadota bacterium]
MRYVFWTVCLLLAFFLAAWLHYTLPQRDVVRIVNADIKRMEVGQRPVFWGRGDTFNETSAISTRDVRFINTFDKDGVSRVYRNEDTGIFGWPPYFKTDSSDLHNEAGDLRSTASEPEWVAITHYGWRSTWFTIFPNAVDARPVDGPDQTFVPWFNIVFLTLFALVALGMIRLLQVFYGRWVYPAIDVLDEAWEDATRPNVPFGERAKSVFRRDRK